ncbi:TetR/AcrR family transcriptional regulator [Oceanicella sp. SM1341]|uniref:TetR/AcrR family transcriptional regulator n=1 Tax=Oceanicella sp. SM1341 TaxID=1548889 RepID=UPI000E4D1356|nr:TetR/AcrR family transcriptional regulator [Oceanicella sp. SM1341]
MPATRRTQSQRSAETRRLLHEATIASLMELGYANTSTQGIAERAGVSRGAQTHHYPGKIDLITAATEAMFEGFAEDVERLAARVRAGEIGLESFVDLLWQEMLNGNWFYSSLEIIVAARGDAELRARLAPLILDLHGRFEAAWEATFISREEGGVSARVALNLVMNVFRGMAVQAVLRKETHYYAEMLQTLKQILAAHVRPAVSVPG